MFRASFIIPSFNSFKTISRTLDSIFGLESSDLILQVIVVDSSDDLETRQLLKKYTQPQLKIIELTQKCPPGKGRNLGAAHANGDLLCFIDSDVFLDKFWLNHIIKAYKAGCRVGGGSVGVPNFQRKNFLALAQLYLQFNESLRAGEIRRVLMVPACNMFVERELFKTVGGFPDLRASEDVLLCLKYGNFTPIWFVPRAHCFHIFRDEKKPYFQNQMVLGKYIIIYRRMIYHKWYYQEPWAEVFLPLFLMVKTVQITGRIMNAGRAHLKKYILSFPLFLAGLFYWGVGFYQGAHQRNMAGDKN